MFRMLLSILLCEVANFLDWSFGSAHVSAPYFKVGKMTVSIIFVLRLAGIFLCLKKCLLELEHCKSFISSCYVQ